MTSYFWKRGFYFNNSLFFFNQFTSYLDLQKLLFGLSFFFSKILFLRIESSTLLGFNLWKNTDYYTFFYYTIITFPTFLDIYNQLKLNLLFFYLTKSNRGISYIINKPLYNKTRARTYLNKKKKIINFLI